MSHIATFDCAFRELIDLWRENDLCDVEYITKIESTGPDTTLYKEARVWVNNIDDILLYDGTILDKYHENYRFALFANEVKFGPKEVPWIFWSRFPRRYYQFLKDNKRLSYNERDIESIYIGNKTNSYRTDDWGKYIKFFSMGNMNNHQEQNMLYPYEEYLKKLSQAKFGLCLRGVGPKSLRENECMGLGVVPIFTPGVSHVYYEPLIENEHYLYADTPEELPEVLNSLYPDQWEWMSNNCIEWWERNSSLLGSYKTTYEILKMNKLL